LESFSIHPIPGLLKQLFRKAAFADGEFSIKGGAGFSAEEVKRLLEEEEKDYSAKYDETFEGHYMNVSPEIGKFLYLCARICKAKRIIEFGTAFGISTIYLACALRDGGGGQLIGTELEYTKAMRARENLAAAGLADLVEIRTGDALETLKEDIGGDVDLVFFDGDDNCYLPVLKLLEPHLKGGSLVIGNSESAFGFLNHVRNHLNGYLSMTLPIEEGCNLEIAVVTW